jgi:hypothetical protein
MKLYELFESALKYEDIVAIKKAITTQIKDPNAKIKSAVELVNQSYQTVNATVPKDIKDDGYKQYSDLMIFTVKALQKSTDIGIRDSSWKMTADDSPFV